MTYPPLQPETHLPEKKPFRDYAETRLQIAINHYLRGEIKTGNQIIRVQAPFPGLLFSYIPGEHTDAKEAFWAKSKGYETGIADFLCWERVNNHSLSAALETKAENGRQTSAQKNFQIRFENKGGIYAIARSVVFVRDFFVAQGLKCYNTACHEPALSKAEQQRRYLEMMRP